jgi:uncharacterized membrane protein YkoI
MKRKLVIGAAALLAAGATGTAAAVAAGDDGEGKVTGRQADRATAAALAETGGGTAKAVERDSENGATWEVEVTTPEGKMVDVRLDENLQVVVVEGDSESSDDSGADDSPIQMPISHSSR